MAKDVEYNLTASDKTGMALRKAEENFRNSNKNIKKETDKLGDGLAKSLVNAVGKVSPQLADTLTKGFASASEASVPLLAQVGLAASPLIAATLSAAIIGGVGIGMAGIGVALVAKGRPEVQDAGKELGKTLLQNLTQDADVFIEPTLMGIKQIDKAFSDLRPRIQSIFKDSSSFLGPLIGGVTGGLDGILRGVEAITSKGRPVIIALSDAISILGDGVGDMFETIAGGSDDAAKAVDDIAIALRGLLQVTGVTVRGLTEVYGFAHDLGEDIGIGIRKISGEATVLGVAFQQHVAGAADNVNSLNNQIQIGSGFIDVYGQQIFDTGQATTLFSDQMQALAGSTGSLFGAVTSAGAAVDNLKSSMEKNGKTLDATTEKGRANRDAFQGVANAYIAQYQAAVKVNGIGPKTDAVAQSNYDSFIRLASSLTGSKSRAAELARQLGVLPPSKNITVTANTASAINNVDRLKAAIASVKGKTVAITVRQTRSGEILYGNQAPQMSAANYMTGSVPDGYGRTASAKTVEQSAPVVNVSFIVDGLEQKFSGIVKNELGLYEHRIKYKGGNR